MKRLLLITAAAGAAIGLAAALGGPGSAATSVASKHATVTIRHQVRGCHAWSVNGRSYRAAQHVRLAGAGTITFVNNDVMPHRLIQRSGPAVRYIGRTNMNHMSASVKVRFPRAGTYRFTTKAGEDYMQGMKTIGEDNVLTLKVVVS
jgi:plastocyanin